MNETINKTDVIPRISSASESVSYIDLQISDILKNFMDGLENDDRPRFRGLETLREKIDYICWVGAERSDTLADAVNLRSLHAIRTLEDVTVSNDPNEERDFLIYSGDSFWRRVDEQMYLHLDNLVKEKAGRDIPSFEQMNPGTVYQLCAIDDYIISRYAEPDSQTVHYYVTPEQAASQKAGTI